MGNQLEDLFEKLIGTISNFSNTLSNATGVSEIGDAAKVMLQDMENLKSNVLPEILSDTIYVTENRNEEIREINEVEGEVEAPITAAGVRG